MKAIIIHTFEDDGTEKIQKFEKEDFMSRMTEIFAEEAKKERKTFIQCREVSDGYAESTIAGTPITLIGYAGKIIQSVSEKTGVPETCLLEIIKEMVTIGGNKQNKCNSILEGVIKAAERRIK